MLVVTSKRSSAPMRADEGRMGSLPTVHNLACMPTVNGMGVGATALNSVLQLGDPSSMTLYTPAHPEH